MQVTLQDDGWFKVKFTEEEMESLKEIQETFKDCTEEFEPEVSQSETLKLVIESGMCWLT
jgi:hypothetical protein